MMSTEPEAALPMPAEPAVYGGRYGIEGELGRGGMGRVLRARDLKLGRMVALKVLATGAHDAKQLRRFEQEARAAGALNHPNILMVFDVGEHAGEPYIVSELLHGATLRTLLNGGSLSPEKAADLASQLGSGLAAAHEAGIVHRDLKPENLFISDEGRLKILDFGIAKLVGTEKPGVSTESGAVIGTAGYMSPEQVRGSSREQRQGDRLLQAVRRVLEGLRSRVCVRRWRTHGRTSRNWSSPDEPRPAAPETTSRYAAALATLKNVAEKM